MRPDLRGRLRVQSVSGSGNDDLKFPLRLEDARSEDRSGIFLYLKGSLMTARLRQARLRIDEIDREMVRLMAERMSAVRNIGEEKNDDQGTPLRDDDRERRVLENWLKEAGAHDLSSYYVGRVLREVMNYSRRMQEDQLDRRGDAAAGKVLRFHPRSAGDSSPGS